MHARARALGIQAERVGGFREFIEDVRADLRAWLLGSDPLTRAE